MVIQPDDPRHGQTRGYHAGCRNPCCKAAIVRYEKSSKYRQISGIKWAIPAIGAQRRIQALMAMGWTSTDIALAAGWNHRNQIFRILKGQKGKPCTWVERKTYRAISDVFERLSMTLPEHSPARARCRSIAAKNGWLPPLAWSNIDDPSEVPRKGSNHKLRTDVDEAVVVRVLAGEQLRTTPAEKDEIVRRWTALGGSFNDLERRLGINKYRHKEAS